MSIDDCLIADDFMSKIIAMGEVNRMDLNDVLSLIYFHRLEISTQDLLDQKVLKQYLDWYLCELKKIICDKTWEAIHIPHFEIKNLLKRHLYVEKLLAAILKNSFAKLV